MDCAAKIYIYHFLTFPDFQIKKNSEWHRKNASKKLKNCVQKENAKGVHSYVVLFPKISDHSNHPITGEAANLREKIDPRVQKKITELYRAGIRKKSELRRLIEHFVNNEIFLGLDVPEGSRRRFFPTRKDISNVIGRSKHLGHGSVLDQSMLVQLVDKWKMDDPSCSIFCRPHSSEESKEEIHFLFLYQAEWQKKLLVRYGNQITLLDATYRTTKYALPLYFLCVRANVGYAVVAAFVTQHERTNSILEALKMIKLWNEAWKPSSFMLDFCLEEINAIEQVFPDAEIFLCDFHREKAWTEWLNKKDHGVHKRKKEILALMRNVALTTNKEEHERALKTLTSSPIWKQSKMLRQWFSQKWLSDIKKWAHIYEKEPK
ncbi:uncharacterized protein [Dendropsophus ebraccatus]|uniref:uncharacterized protein n=1 Tax=Dendropsophus ebraccatus TaxID=150705 RepID=UPI003831608E